MPVSSARTDPPAPLPGGSYHLAGIAGVGMSALAQALADAGCRVSGSDRHLDQGRDLEVLRTLEAAGVRLFPQDGSGLTAATSALVRSTAVEAGNADLEAARRLGLPVLHRAHVLAQLVAGRRGVAVAGTCGKTTVTGMAGWLLEQLGADPTVINGGAVVNWTGGARLGSVRRGASGLCVYEADESDRSFLVFEPDWAVVTNISKDHFELDEAVALFREFAGRVREGVVAGPGAAALLRGAIDDARLHLPTPPARVRPGAGGGVAFEYAGLTFEIPLPGRHNAENAWIALALCERLGLDLARARDAFREFRGIRRRLELVGRAGGVTVRDDYAHNPEKLRAAWAAAAEAAPRVAGVWRPHGFGPLSLMMEELAAAFAAACRPQDRLCLLPVYYAGGTAHGAATSEDLAARLRARGAKAEVFPDYAALEAELVAWLRADDTLLVMGARDPDLPVFARRMVERLAARNPQDQTPKRDTHRSPSFSSSSSSS